MVEYLIGTKDYYKVVSNDNKKITLIHSFNVHNTLNKPSEKKISAITVPVLELPTELVAMKYKSNSNNTVEMYLNNGWQLSFRIHNASSKVEPSLKFDILRILIDKKLNVLFHYLSNESLTEYGYNRFYPFRKACLFFRLLIFI